MGAVHRQVRLHSFVTDDIDSDAIAHAYEKVYTALHGNPRVRAPTPARTTCASPRPRSGRDARDYRSTFLPLFTGM